MAVYLARDCPRCGNYFGVVIAKSNGSGYQPIHGRCAACGYEIAWRSSRPELPTGDPLRAHLLSRRMDRIANA